MKVSFTELAWSDYLWLQKRDKRLLKRVNLLIKDVMRDAFEGIGKPEPFPDIAVFAWSRIPRTERRRIANRFDCHPDWVIEILSPEQSANQVVEKILYCLNAGTRLGWLIDPQDESVMVLQPDGLPQVRSGAEPLPVLEGLDRLNLSAQQIFAWLVV
jgi:Txe/YoeB family toxin of toxin-antitoxin system